VGTSPRAGVVETRVYVLVDTRPPLQGDHELFMRPDDLPVAGPFVAGPQGVTLSEVMMGRPTGPFPADLDAYERFLADRGVRQLPNPPIDMPEWLEDTRS
jgi:hypothetical protein